MQRFIKTVLVLSLFSVLAVSSPALAHEQPVTGLAYFEITRQFPISTGAVAQVCAGGGSATTINDFSFAGNQVVYPNDGVLIGHAILTTARGELWISYFGYLDADFGFFFGYVSIDGGTEAFEGHYGFGGMAADLAEEGNWIYIDAIKNHP